MSEHLLFLQAAGSDFGSAHDLVAAVTEIIRAPHGETPVGSEIHRNSGTHHATAHLRHPERMVERFTRAGCEGHESLFMALSVLTTTASPLRPAEIDWIASLADRIADPDLLLEMAGVVFAFNTINRIADARRVRLEYHFLREWKPIKGWVERGLAWLAGVAYDLSVRYQPRHSPAELQDRLGALFERLGVSEVPDVFSWLSRSPVVLEGVLEMLDVNVTHSRVRTDLMKEAIAIGVASRAMPGSALRKVFDQWLPTESSVDSKTLRAWAAPAGVGSESGLVSTCRRYAWQVANAAYTITDEQIHELSALGLSDAERLDLTLATSAFSALAIIEPISMAVAPAVIATDTTLPSTKNHQGPVQLV